MDYLTMVCIKSRRLSFVFFGTIISLILLLGHQKAFGNFWTEDNYIHFSKEEPLREVLKAMAEYQGSHIIISEKITEYISEYFRKENTADVFYKLKRKYNLVSYADGDTLYVYKMDELRSVSIIMKKSPIIHLERELQNSGMLTEKFQKETKWQTDTKNNKVSFRAPPHFVEVAQNMAQKLDKNDYIYKWKDKSSVIHYSNEPPFSGVKYMKIIKVANRELVPEPFEKNMPLDLAKENIDTVEGEKK